MKPGLEHVHGDGPVARAGRPAAEAHAGIVLVHGRGATPESILTLLHELPADRFAAVAPGASVRTAHPRSWYPNSFLAPLEANEPGLSSGLARIGEAVTELEDAGIPAERVVLLGFSQGACLTAEYVARHPKRWGGVAILTGGVQGPAGRVFDDPGGALDGTPIFLGSSDPDPHVPVARVHETAEIFRRKGAQVEAQLYPGMPHTIFRDELDRVAAMMNALEQ